MNIPHKSQWNITASGGDPRLAIDGRYATAWTSPPAQPAWLEIDLGETVLLGGIEVYWGLRACDQHGFAYSLDGNAWTHLCKTRVGEGGLNVFAFPPTAARYLRWSHEGPSDARGLEIVEINLYSPGGLFTVRETPYIAALGHAPARLAAGESITIDFGYTRSPLGTHVIWGESHGTDFSVHLSDDGEQFREVGRISNGNGDYDSFYWRVTTSRYLRFTVHAASALEGAVIQELKLRILNKDRMPIGGLERAARDGRGELHPQSLLARQIYWTVLGETDQAEEALFDEYGNLEPRAGFGQITPLLRLGEILHGVPGAGEIRHSLAEGSLPIPSVAGSFAGSELHITAYARDGQVTVEYRIYNRDSVLRSGSLVLALRPVQINPYWQHGGHANTESIRADGSQVWVNDRLYAVFAGEPQSVTLAEFADGDVIRLIEQGPHPTARSLRSDSGLLSAAFEFDFALARGEEIAYVVAFPLRAGVMPTPPADFATARDQTKAQWRAKLGPRRIVLGDGEISDTVEAQIGLILVNATRDAFKPGPRHYDRTWIRDGSSQALALLYAGLAEEAKRYVLWYSQRIYENGMVPPILNPDGSVNRGYGSDIEFDAQGEFVGIAAEVYRFTRDPDFLQAIYPFVLRATGFIEELRACTSREHGPETRFHGLLAPSISHEGYNKPTFSYWDDYFALSAWRNCAYLATEIGDEEKAAWAAAKGKEFAADLARSLRMTAELQGLGFVPASADRNDVDPTSTSIAFEPCRVEDVLPQECLRPTYERYREHLAIIRAPDFEGGFTPYEIRNLNAFVALGWFEDAIQLLNDALAWRRPAGWRHWAEVVWGNPRVAEYIGDMPHTWIGAEFSTAIRRMLVRENGSTLELFRAVPDAWWDGEGIVLRNLPTAFGGKLQLAARRDATRVTVELAFEFVCGGAAPESIVVRYPGAKRALADDDKICAIEGDCIRAPYFSRLSIEY